MDCTVTVETAPSDVKLLAALRERMRSFSHASRKMAAPEAKQAKIEKNNHEGGDEQAGKCQH